MREVTVERIVYGGEGLAHVEEGAVLVPLSAPGDRLRIETARRGGVMRGRIEEILAPSAQRREPPCADFGTCGGCQLQHLDYAAQLEAKAGFVRDCLRRIGGIRYDAPIEVRAAAELGYRSRAELHVARDAAGPGEADGTVRLGYFRAGSRDLCEVRDCPILLPSLRAELARLRREPESVPRGAAHVTLTASDDGTVALGRGTALQRIAGVDYRFGAASFVQGNRLLVEDLVAVAVGDARGGTAVDLYAGAGLFTLQLAKTFGVVHAVEEDPALAKLLRGNALANGFENVRWAKARVLDWLASEGASLQDVDLVLLDPPRAGAGRAVVERLDALDPGEIAYVSCDPATLARDLRGLVDLGWEIRSLVALDLYPQTTHVESVARLRRAS